MRDRIGGIVSIPVDELLLVKDGVPLVDDAQTLASKGICQGTLVTFIKKACTQPVELIQPAQEVKIFLRQVAAALKREPTSLDEIADKLIAGEIVTKNQLKDLHQNIAQECGLTLLVRSQI